jgi:hypothetical protein
VQRWQSQRKHQEAYDLLVPMYGWFTEEFDTADVQEAGVLLHQSRVALGEYRPPIVPFIAVCSCLYQVTVSR